MFKVKLFLTASLVMVAGLVSWAQPAAIQQLQNSQIQQQQQNLLPAHSGLTNPPELYQGENLDVGPQKILRMNPPHLRFDVLADSQVFYTDNANFADPPNNIGSFVFVNTIQAAYAPGPFELGQGKLAPSIGLASQWYNYSDDQMQPFDFDAQTIFGTLKYTVGKWQFGAGLNFTRLVNQSGYDETYHEFMPTLGAQRIFVLNDDLLLIVGGQSDYHFTRVPPLLVVTNSGPSNINNRFDAIASFSLNWQLTKHFVVQPFYRLQYSYYPINIRTISDRNDLLQNLGITAAWYVTKQFTIRAFFSYNFKQSDDPSVADFDELNGGLGASLDLKF